VGIGAQAEQGQVQIERVSERLAQPRRLLGRGGLRGVAARPTEHLLGRDRDAVQPRLAGRALVAVGMVERHVAFVAPGDPQALPREVEALPEPAVARQRRAAARQRDHEPAPSGDGMVAGGDEARHPGLGDVVDDLKLGLHAGERTTGAARRSG